MRIGLHLPEQRPGLRVQSVHVGLHVAEVNRIAPLPDRLHGNGGARHRRRLVGPVLAARPRVERIDGSVSTAQEEPAAGDYRLRRRHGLTCESERPFQFESRHLLPVEARGLGGLEAAVRQVHAPSGPARFPRRNGKLRSRASPGLRLRLHAGPAGNVSREGQPLGGGQRGALRLHRAGFERRQDFLLAEQLERGGQRRADFTSRLVTAGAMLRKKRRRILR